MPECSVNKIPFELSQVWLASMYWEPSTIYTRMLFKKTRDAWASGIGKEAFLAKTKDDLELRRAFTEHMRRHGPFTIDLIPLALPDEEIVEC